MAKRKKIIDEKMNKTADERDSGILPIQRLYRRIRRGRRELERLLVRVSGKRIKMSIKMSRGCISTGGMRLRRGRLRMGRK